jgi:hypothetical protein
MDHSPRAAGRRRLTRAVAAAAVVAWGMALAVPPVLLVRSRAARLAELDAATVQSDWDAFRDDMRRQSDRSGPVQRKVPRSAEPPERVWLRDHLALAITAWVALVGVLGGVLGFLLVGVVGGRPTQGLSGPGSTGPKAPPPGKGSA